MTGSNQSSDDIFAELEIRANDSTLIENNIHRRALAALVAERALSDTLAAALEAPLPQRDKALAAWRVARGGQQ